MRQRRTLCRRFAGVAHLRASRKDTSHGSWPDRTPAFGIGHSSPTMNSEIIGSSLFRNNRFLHHLRAVPGETHPLPAKPLQNEPVCKKSNHMLQRWFQMHDALRLHGKQKIPALHNIHPCTVRFAAIEQKRIIASRDVKVRRQFHHKRSVLRSLRRNARDHL